MQQVPGVAMWPGLADTTFFISKIGNVPTRRFAYLYEQRLDNERRQYRHYPIHRRFPARRILVVGPRNTLSPHSEPVDARVTAPDLSNFGWRRFVRARHEL